ncbi:hypothetical protein [uncultured Microbacterium sp.]|uniref:hypothetical protein n=1 Tax=uncultured Microbacterium sp. TaxID=191216 RepID=UPI0025DBD85C|nr:hypothetical protein [uncultured Microbacterium sp.]
MAEISEDRTDAAGVERPGLPFWVKALGWLQLVAIALIVVAIVALQVVQAQSSGVNYSAAALAIIFALPLLVVWQQPVVAAAVAIVLVVGAALGVRFGRGRMSVGEGIWGYALLAWTLFWVAMCVVGAARIFGSLMG